MIRKTALSKAAAILLLCLALFIVLHRSDDPPRGSKDTDSAPGDRVSVSNPPSKRRAKPGRADAHRDLVAKYGEPSIQLCEDTFGLWLARFDKTLRGSGTGILQDPKQTVLELSRALRLSTSQEAAARTAIEARQDRLIEKGRALSNALHRNPGPLVEFLAAGDAFARQRLSQDELTRVIARADEFVRLCGGGTELLSDVPNSKAPDYVDPDVRKAIEATLDPDQTRIFRTIVFKETHGFDLVWSGDEPPRGSFADVVPIDVRILNDLLNGRPPDIKWLDDPDFNPQQDASIKQRPLGDLDEKQAFEKMLRDDAASRSSAK